jgi:hypothetical protein
VFERLSTSWGDQMSSVLRNAILAFLESERGGTLADLRRFLLDTGFRNAFLKTVHDPEVVYYWQKAFPQLTGNKSIGPVMTRLDTFLSPKPIRYMVSQRVNRLDFAEIMDTGKIFLAKLPQGQIGRENSYLLGSVLVAKCQQAAMARQRFSERERRFFWLYIDEFHHFITPSMAEILTGARKYRVGLVLAHQELRQLERDSEVASAVLSNPYARIVFRVGDADARALAEGFSFYRKEDIQSLGIGEAICRVERSDFDFNISVAFPSEPDSIVAAEQRERIIASSRARYATPRAEVEAMLRESLEVKEEEEHLSPAEGEVTKRERRGKSVAPPKSSLSSSSSSQGHSAQTATPESVERVGTTSEPPPTTDVAEPEEFIATTEPTSMPAPDVVMEPKFIQSEAAIPFPNQQPETHESKPPVSQFEVVARTKEESHETSQQSAVPAPLPDMGRGGAQHQAIQQRLKAVAEGLGFRVIIEKAVLDGQGSIDLVLQKSGHADIACEVNISSTLDYEVGNVSKCLKAGFAQIVVLSPRQDRLARLKQAVHGCFSPEQVAKISFYLPDEFITYLQNATLEKAKMSQTAEPVEERRRGYKVRRQFVELSPEEAKAREESALKMLAEKMRHRRVG